VRKTDIFNEKPSKEEQMGATQVSTVKGQNSQAYENYKLVTFFSSQVVVEDT